MAKTKYLSLRVDEITRNKLHYLSIHEKRSVNGQIYYLIRKYIKEYENEHGEIEIKIAE